jgi:cell division protein ZapA
MAQVQLRVAGRLYSVSCHDGEEEHLIRLAATVDRKCSEATQVLGVMGEPRLLFTAALLLADELAEAKAGAPAPAAAPADTDDVEQKIADMARRVENLCAALEGRGPTS